MIRTLRFEIASLEFRVSLPWLAIAVALLGISIYVSVPNRYPQRDAQILFVALAITGLAASLTLHELAHVAIARSQSVDFSAISPQLVGALPDTLFEAQSPSSEVRVGLAGPVASFTLAAITGALWLGTSTQTTGEVATALGLIALVNLGIGVISLMPGYPFDGGRILRGVIWYLSGDLMTSTKIVGYLGYVVVMAGMTLGVLLVVSGDTFAVWGIWVLMTAFMINNSVAAGISHIFWSEHSRRLRVDDLFVGGTRRIQYDTTIDDAIERMLEGHGDGPLMVFRDGSAVGLIDLADVRPVPRKLWTTRVVGDVMAPISGLESTTSSSQLSELISLLPPDQNRIALITRNCEVIGATDREDVVRRLQQYLAAERLDKLRRGGR